MTHLQAADTSEYSLNGGLETAVRGCSARHEPDDTLGRLRVRLHRGSSLETGASTTRAATAHGIATALQPAVVRPACYSSREENRRYQALEYLVHPVSEAVIAAGWDRFGLAYDLDEPLATAVTSNSVMGYKRLSRCWPHS